MDFKSYLDRFNFDEGPLNMIAEVKNTHTEAAQLRTSLLTPADDFEYGL